MNKVDLKAKLSSRKFGALVAALATSILGAVGASDDTAVKDYRYNCSCRSLFGVYVG
ncbi:hypothetical protein NST04_28980 [Paenibacillus sp. FSL H7-0756]|uniref:hypothetical protein n=1 Tax=Paenibacillus sp. FSL H7-0756 TaxID=2954738 RepID=UPI0030FA8EF3